MMSRISWMRRLLCLLVFAVLPPLLPGRAQEPADAVVPRTSDQLISDVRKSLVVIRAGTRDGTDQGIGTGFVISEDGLVATARHVIGDGRPLSVELPQGGRAEVTEVFATSSQLDLAILRISNHSLPALPLGTAADIVQGRDVIAMGHPRGFRNSVVKGVISGHRSIEGVDMLQLAMPIEPGNSGGPLVDLDGRVLGIVTLKSTVSNNLGFALPVNLLADLRNDPNPVPMDRWQTIGALNPREWTVVFGGRWRQRAGRIVAEGTGVGFGGRTLCVSQSPPPGEQYDVQVTVRLEDESGAAGLILHSDGGDRHYGFYPSNGNLRLTRFDGPDVNSWTILHNAPHPAYRAGEWNQLRVRVTAEGLECLVNDQVVVTSDDDVLPTGKVGLASFRGTEATFRQFQCAAEIGAAAHSDELRSRLEMVTDSLTLRRPAPATLVEELMAGSEQSGRYLKQKSQDLRLLADQLQQLAVEVHQADIRDQLLKALLLKSPDDDESDDDESDDDESDDDESDDDESVTGERKPDLERAALLIARFDNEEVDVQAYQQRIESMAAEIRSALPENADSTQRLKALDD
ncbi:MAG: trypsin-like peptidase domain-containing protein, partial [Planctomycetaceae bacterium]|nr:trypsin-like peptidase domain-containing protein [Planctomycetaceae bacterium]